MTRRRAKKRGTQSQVQAHVRFLRATHDDGDHAVFSLGREHHDVGQSEASAVCLPGPGIRLFEGDVLRTEAGLRYLATFQTESAPIGVRIGAFTLAEVESAELEDGPCISSPWACRFHPRPLERAAGLALVARQESHARGASLVVDVDDEAPSLQEALTWLPADRVVDIARADLDATGSILPRTRLPRDLSWPEGHDTTAHLMRPHHVVETNELCLALMPFFPSVTFRSLIRIVQAGGVDVSIVVGILRQFSALMDERQGTDLRTFPLNWPRLQLGFDGRLRLPMAGPWDWQDGAATPNTTAVTTSVLAMFAEDAGRQHPLQALLRRMQANGWEGVFESGASVVDIGRWLSAIAPIARERQEHFRTLAQMIS